MSSWRKHHFSVDSELLRELGERLVGRQYIALAELVKNSFDADATRVEIRIENDFIEVSDNGHGMSVTDFRNRWMRVGSAHKVREQMSPELKRPLTGSKGIGRLAVQFLASELMLCSVPKATRLPPNEIPVELRAWIDWKQAVQAGELVRASAMYDLQSNPTTHFPSSQPHGTTVRLKGLKHEWNPQEFEELAREIWFLQPPFRALPGTIEGHSDFSVELFTSDPEAIARFRVQMTRILDLYQSRIIGKLLPDDCQEQKETLRRRKVHLSLELEKQPADLIQYTVPVRGDGPCLIDSLHFEIRIYTLKYRQPYGLPVQQARDYMWQWGGVHIYDAGFRIPYAGPDADWLRLEFDHAHRLTKSRLLPDELHVPLGLNHLPTNSRVLGVVHIDTAHEARMEDRHLGQSNQHLQIQVSRDRLVGNYAYEQLRDSVRYALDFYSLRLAAMRLKEQEAKRRVQTPESIIGGVLRVLEQHSADMPKTVAKQITKELDKTVDVVREQSQWTRQQSGILGAMATVGVTALAFDHQFQQHLNVLESYIASLRQSIQTKPDLAVQIGPVTERIEHWLRDARGTRTIFSPIADERNRTAILRFRARTLIEDLATSLKSVLRGVEVSVSGIDHNMRLPETNYPVWMAIFHNLFMNASNAMLDSKIKRIAVSSFATGTRRGIWVQDTGVGIDLDCAEDLFSPLKRSLEISLERRALGFGGTGLGLAIVRMLATDLKADVHFIEPEAPYNTCFEIVWNEQP